MFDFLGRKRRKAAKSAPVGTPVKPTVAQASTTQRELLRLTLQNVLRHNGIPVHWIGCETVPTQLTTQGQSVMVQLVVRQWHDALMHYAVAIEHGIVDGLRRIDPSVTPANHLFSWQFAHDCGCPHTQFPKHDFWIIKTAPALAKTPTLSTQPVSAAATKPATPAPAPTKPKFDLPRTAADLPRADDDDDDHGFAATQIDDIK